MVAFVVFEAGECRKALKKHTKQKNIPKTFVSLVCFSALLLGVVSFVFLFSALIKSAILSRFYCAWCTIIRSPSPRFFIYKMEKSCNRLVITAKIWYHGSVDENKVTCFAHMTNMLCAVKPKTALYRFWLMYMAVSERMRS